MFLKLLFFPILVSSLRTTPTTPSKLQHPSPTVVYTAETARQQESPNAATYRPPTAYDYDPTGPSGPIDIIESPSGREDKPENSGFVEPIDFNSFLSDVARKSGGGSGSGSNLSPFTSESKSKDSFSGFFDDGSRRNSYSEPHFGSLSSSASNQKSKKANGETDDEGFVDPNVQFRSLFDSTETADGFRPNDFLGYKDDSVGADPSKGSQTRAFPSFTYSGRQDEDDYGGGRQNSPDNPNERYRSSYRQVDSRDQPRQQDPYDDGNYYNGERDESPRGPSPPPRRYKINEDDASYGPGNNGGGGGGGGNRESYSPTVQETAHSPQASRGKPKGTESSASGKNKCKKVEKQVDTEEDYSSYADPNEPSPNYDPSTYSSRYKRQSGRGGRGGGGGRRQQKKPMTCYVCEDEQGRYAERCSYDSKADPKQGSYFHSSSTSFNDNGKGNGRGNNNRDRFKRQPALVTSASVTTVIKSSSSNESLPKKVEKRQSEGDRYASGYGEDGRNGDREREGGEVSEGGRNGPDIEDFDDYEGQSNEGQGGQGGRGRNSGENQGYVPNYSPGSSSRRPGGGSGTTQGTRGYDFGPPADFGRDQGQNSQGFDYDFTIPRDFDPDVQLGTSNTNNRPIFSGSTNTEFSPNGGFDVGYEDYVKKYFPDAFGSPGGGGGGGSTPGPSSASSSFRPEAAGSSPGPPPGADYSPNYYHRNRQQSNPERQHSPERQHTQQSHNVAPRPYYGGGGGRGGGSGGGGGGGGHGQDEPYEGQEHLVQAISAFGQKERNGCEKVQKGDMTCYVCRDPRGMKKEECMYKSNDPRNTAMAYHEVSEYSSLPPASILPLPKPQLAPEESKRHEVKKLPTDYDFDY